MSGRTLTILTRGALALAALIALVVVAAALFFGGLGHSIDRLYEAWPTLSVLAVLIALSATLSSAWHSRVLRMAALTGWLVSGFFYLLSYRPYASVADLLVVSIVAGVPIFLMSLALLGTRRLGWPPLTRVSLSATLAVVLAWLVLPLWLLAACVITQDCI